MAQDQKNATILHTFGVQVTVSLPTDNLHGRDPEVLRHGMHKQKHSEQELGEVGFLDLVAFSWNVF